MTTPTERLYQHLENAILELVNNLNSREFSVRDQEYETAEYVRNRMPEIVERILAIHDVLDIAESRFDWTEGAEEGEEAGRD